MTEKSRAEILKSIENIIDETKKETVIENRYIIQDNVSPTVKLHGKMIFTIKEVAQMFGVADVTIKKLIDNGDMKAIYLNQIARISYKEIDRFIEEFIGNMKYKN